jgi:hypothetical protein
LQKVYVLKGLGLNNLEIESNFFEHFLKQQVFNQTQSSQFFREVNAILDDLLIQNVPDELTDKPRDQKSQWLNDNYSRLVQDAEEEEISRAANLREIYFEEALKFHSDYIDGLSESVIFDSHSRHRQNLGMIYVDPVTKEKVLVSAEARTSDDDPKSNIEVLVFHEGQYRAIDPLNLPQAKLVEIVSQFRSMLDEKQARFLDEQIDKYDPESQTNKDINSLRVLDYITSNGDDLIWTNSEYTSRIPRLISSLQLQMQLNMLRKSDNIPQGNLQYLNYSVQQRYNQWSEAFPDYLQNEHPQEFNFDTHAINRINSFLSQNSYNNDSTPEKIESDLWYAIYGYKVNPNIGHSGIKRAMISDIAKTIIHTAANSQVLLN